MCQAQRSARQGLPQPVWSPEVYEHHVYVVAMLLIYQTGIATPAVDSMKYTAISTRLDPVEVSLYLTLESSFSEKTVYVCQGHTVAALARNAGSLDERVPFAKYPRSCDSQLQLSN